MGKKLRVGLLIDSYQIPSWAYVMIEQIVGRDYEEIALIVKNAASILPKKIGIPTQATNLKRFFFLHIAS